MSQIIDAMVEQATDGNGLDVEKFALLVADMCVQAFSETRTEPSLSQYIRDRLGIDK
jgi:hypothetical protein